MERAPLALALLLTSVGTHVAAWRHPEAELNRSTDFTFFREVAEEAERAYYDLLFIADTLYVETAGAGIERRWPRHAHMEFEPLTLLAALAVVTDRIGLAATVSTTYSAPYAVARAIASLDHLSNGRAGWNVVTSQSNLEAHNFGLDLHAGHTERYARAAEYVDVVTRLWDSWETDATATSNQQQTAVDVSRLHKLDHKGEHYLVEGPLNIRRSPQGRPVVIQAGSSAPGRKLAAATADVIFTAQDSIDNAIAFRRSIHDALPDFGRRPEDVRVMAGIFAVVAPTENEAKAKFAALQELIDPAVGLALLSNILQVDLTGLNVDARLPEIADTNASKSRLAAIQQMGARSDMTVRELYTQLAPARGHFTFVGAADEAAEVMAGWYQAGAVDGFMLVPGVTRPAQRDFDSLVLPRLRGMGLVRKDYVGATLREHLGLPVPANRFSGGSRSVA